MSPMRKMASREQSEDENRERESLRHREWAPAVGGSAAQIRVLLTREVWGREGFFFPPEKTLFLILNSLIIEFF